MVKGLDTFRKYFADYEEQYVLTRREQEIPLFLKQKRILICKSEKIQVKKWIPVT